MNEEGNIPEGPVDPSLDVPPPTPLASDGATASALATAGDQESIRSGNEAQIPQASPLDAPDLSHRSPELAPHAPDNNPSAESALRERLPDLPSPESIIPRSSMNVAGEQTMAGIGNDQQTAVWEVWPRPTFIAEITADNGNASYAFQEQAGPVALENFGGGRNGNLTEVNGVTGITVGTKVVVSMLRGQNAYGYYTEFGGAVGNGTLNVAYYSCDSGGSYTSTLGVANLYFGGPSQLSGAAHDIGYVHPEVAVNSGGISPNFTYYGHVWRLTVGAYPEDVVFPCSKITTDNTGTDDDAVDLHVATGAADTAGLGGASTGLGAILSANIKNIGNITLTTHWDNSGPGSEDGSQSPTRTLYFKDLNNGTDGTGKFIGVEFNPVANTTTKKVSMDALVRADLNDLDDVDLSANATYRDRTKHTMMLAYDANAGKWVRLLADEREVVTDVSWDAGNHTLKQTKRTLYILGMQIGNATTSNIDVAVLDSRP